MDLLKVLGITRVLPDGSCTDEDFGDPDARIMYVVYHDHSKSMTGDIVLADRGGCLATLPGGGIIDVKTRLGFKADFNRNINIPQDEIDKAINEYLETK